MFEQHLEHGLQEALGAAQLESYTMLSKSGHPAINQLVLQDALVKSAPTALKASFLQVDAEFLMKNVVCVLALGPGTLYLAGPLTHMVVAGAGHLTCMHVHLTAVPLFNVCEKNTFTI